MKKIRLLLAILMLSIAAFALTACGKVEEPTLSDVEQALKDEGYIRTSDEEKESKKSRKNKDEDEDEEDDVDEEAAKEADANDAKSNSDDDYSYEVTIDKSKLNDDKDKASVDATLVEKEGPISTTTSFEITFKYNSDKKTWKCKKVEIDDGPETEMVSGISEEKAKELLKDSSFYPGDVYVSNDSIKSIEVSSESELDPRKLTDTKTVHITAAPGRYDVEFDLNVVYSYSQRYSGGGEWYLYDYDVDLSTLKEELSEDYFNIVTKDEDIINGLLESGKSFYVLGGSYTIAEDAVELTNLITDEPDLDGSTYVYVPVRFDAVIGGRITIHCNSEATYYYDDDTNSWSFEYVNYPDYDEYEADLAETWKGTINKSEDNKKGDEITMTITGELDDDGYPLAQIKVVPSDKETKSYSWTARITSYEFNDDFTLKASFVDWIGNRPDGVYSNNLSGPVDNGKWTSDSSYLDFEMKLQDGEAVVDDQPDDPAQDEDGIVGKWFIAKGSYFFFNEDGSMGQGIDISDTLHFTSEGGCYFYDQEEDEKYELGEDYVVESGKKILVYADDKDQTDENLIIELKEAKEEGKYTIESGIIYDSFSESFSDIDMDVKDLRAVIEDEEFYIEVTGFTYEIDDDTLVINDEKGILGLNDETAFSIDDGVLTLIVDGEEIQLHRD